MGLPTLEHEVLLAAEEGASSSSVAGVEDESRGSWRELAPLHHKRQSWRGAGTMTLVAIVALVGYVAHRAVTPQMPDSSRSHVDEVVVLQSQIGDATQLRVKKTSIVFQSVTTWVPVRAVTAGSKVIASGPPRTHGGKQLVPIRAIVEKNGAYKEQIGAVQVSTLDAPADEEKLPDAPLPPGLAGGFDCNAGFKNWRWGWSANKRKYCCEHAGRGCAGLTTNPPSFDCTAGVANLEVGWSSDKKDFCCRTVGKGCAPMTSTSPDPFDCEAGINNYEIGWSVWKKRWCCVNRRRGCPDSRHINGVCHIDNLNYQKLLKQPEVKSDVDAAISDALAFLARGSDNRALGVDVSMEDWEGVDGEVVVRFKISPSEQVLMHDVHKRVVADALPEVMLPALKAVSKMEDVVQFSKLHITQCNIDSIDYVRCTCPNGTPEEGSECPAEGGTVCKSCSLGYSMSPGGACEPNTCTCESGMPAKGAACHSDGKEICGYCNTGYHLNKTDPVQTRCIANACSCADGTPVSGEECDNHNANICKLCRPGYHVDTITKQCFANVCTCFNGFSVPDGSPLCQQHGAQQCQRCVDYFHVENGECKANECHCPNGVAAVGQGPPGCRVHGGHVCVNCNEGLHLQMGNICGEKQCVCLNGTAATGDACLMHRGNICQKCDESFSLQNMQCVKDQCQCSHGVPVMGQECRSDQSQHCASCNNGYHLEGNECKHNQCTCLNGIPAMGEVCVHPGTEVCADCSEGFHHKAVTASDSDSLLIQCVKNECVCQHGFAATADSFPKCVQDQDHTCQSCESGYFITDHGTCQPKVCTCEHGEPSRLDECEWDGAEDCLSCMDGFHLTAEGANVSGTRFCRSDTATSAQPFDCSAGYENRANGWSTLKKHWCCDVQHIGCSNQEFSGKELCEGKGLTERQCNLIGCCVFDPTELGCMSGVGDEPCHHNFLIGLKGSLPKDSVLDVRSLQRGSQTDPNAQALCLEALDAYSPGGAVGISSCNSYEPKQQWRYNEGWLVNQLGLCIQIAGSVGNNAALQMANCTENEPEQQWTFVESELQFRSKASVSHCLAVHADDVTDGQLATVLECLQLPTQQWLLPSEAVGSWNPTTVTTTAPPVPLFCPSGSLQIGGLNADISTCVSEGCDVQYDVASAKACDDLCGGVDWCKSFTWAPVGGDMLHMTQTVCSLKRDDVPDQQWGPNQIMCRRSGALVCPLGTTQAGELNADVNTCGSEGCKVQYDLYSIEECRAKCERHQSCKSFTWAPIGGDKMHMKQTVCSLYEDSLPDQKWGPKQIMCTFDGRSAPPDKCERCPIGQCQRTADGYCELFHDAEDEAYHCAVERCELVPKSVDGDGTAFSECWHLQESAFYSIKDPDTPCAQTNLVPRKLK